METVVDKLKSKKLWLAVLGAVIPVVNQQFNLHLDTSTVLGVEGVIATAIGGIAHVDAKAKQVEAALAASGNNSHSQVIDGFIKLSQDVVSALKATQDTLSQLAVLGVIPAPEKAVAPIAVIAPTPAEQTLPASEPTADAIFGNKTGQ